ncbi:MAG: VOC family protein [Pseudomonadota bacterium]
MTAQSNGETIFHLSFPVRDLDEGLRFYTAVLGGVEGRREDVWADVALFGAQLTLQHVPDDVLEPMPRSRHFGATLPWRDWEVLVGTLSDFVEPPRIDHRDTAREQAKAMVQDPSGNLIELKAYRHPEAVLGILAEGARP